jgi:hypothetical protein
MGLEIPFGFTLSSPQPIDARFVFQDETARNALDVSARYEGLKVYVRSTATFYSLIGGIDNSDWAPDSQVSGVMQVVNHGATASVARPAGAAAVYWIGSVEPENKETYDLWFNTAL